MPFPEASGQPNRDGRMAERMAPKPDAVRGVNLIPKMARQGVWTDAWVDQALQSPPADRLAGQVPEVVGEEQDHLATLPHPLLLCPGVLLGLPACFLGRGGSNPPGDPQADSAGHTS